MPGYTPPVGMPSVFDPAFSGVGQKPGLDIFRIEKFQVVKKSPSDSSYKGEFFAGDCYIVLHTKLRGNALERDIFFWLGKDSSQDEQGACAYKTVELDQSLGDEPVQHRETQGYESDEFLHIFKGGVRYKEGGVDSGFKKVDRDAYTTRLLHIKGRRNIRVQVVPCEPKSLNSGDVFVLDTQACIFQWNGKEASSVEKQKGLTITKRVRDEERGGKTKIAIVNEGTDDDAAFWEAMGTSKTRIKSAKEGGSDEAHTRASEDNTKLYHVTDTSGKITVTEMTEKPFKKSHLDTNDAYILDVAGTALFAWIGKKASNDEKLHSWRITMDFVKSKGYPTHIPVQRVVQGAETPLFKSVFREWPDENALKPGAPSGRPRSKFVKRTSDFSAQSLHQAKARDAQKMPDDGTGTLQIWRVEDMELAEYPKDLYGQFFGGDSYLLLYTYLVNGREMYIIYFWQGKTSSQDEKAASAIWAVKKDDELGGAAVQVRVVQNKEPPHFYAMFKGKMVVHAGGKASGFKNRADVDSYDKDGTRLFQVRGTNADNVRAIQTVEKASYLNSGDAFILETPAQVYLWYGKGCNGDEREAAKAIARVVSPRETVLVLEGKENDEFWAALGGQTAYQDSAAVQSETAREARLFQCSNASGNFDVEEVFDFDQEDLIESDVMILDTYNEIFVWVGKDANDVEKKESLNTALAYVKSDPSGRTVDDTVLLQIKQGFEPPNFTAHFFAWDPEKWSKGMTYEELQAELVRSNPRMSVAATPTSVVAEAEKWSTDMEHPYAALIDTPLPEGVDAQRKEQYLGDAEFQTYFGMTKTEFNALPKWKQSGLKKKAKLF